MPIKIGSYILSISSWLRHYCNSVFMCMYIHTPYMCNSEKNGTSVCSLEIARRSRPNLPWKYVFRHTTEERHQNYSFQVFNSWGMFRSYTTQLYNHQTKRIELPFPIARKDDKEINIEVSGHQEIIKTEKRMNAVKYPTAWVPDDSIELWRMLNDQASNRLTDRQAFLSNTSWLTD